MRPGEFFRLAGRALKTSYRARGTASTLVSVAGFALALLPTFVSAAARLTDAVQGVYTGEVALDRAFVLLAVLVALYIGKQLYDAARSYFASADAERTMRYIKEVILRTTCDVKMKYIDNSDDFAEKVAFADSHAGLQVAGSMQEVATQLQNVVAFSGLAFVMASVSPWIIPVVIVTCLPSVILAYRQERETACSTSRGRDAARSSRCTTRIARGSSACKRRVFCASCRISAIEKWRRSVDEYVAANNALVLRHTLANCAADVFRGSVYLIVLVLVAAKIYEDPAVGLGAFTLAVSAAGQMQAIVSPDVLRYGPVRGARKLHEGFLRLGEARARRRGGRRCPRCFGPWGRCRPQGRALAAFEDDIVRDAVAAASEGDSPLRRPRRPSLPTSASST